MSFCSLASPMLAVYVCLHSSSAEIPHWEAFLSEKQRAPENRQCRELPGRLWTVGNLCVSVCVWSKEGNINNIKASTFVPA